VNSTVKRSFDRRRAIWATDWNLATLYKLNPENRRAEDQRSAETTRNGDSFRIRIAREAERCVHGSTTVAESFPATRR
jgi:hypothetical protein